MDSEQNENLIEDTCCDSREDTLRSMIREFYNRKMLSCIILIWAYSIVFIALAVFSGVKFFKADQTRGQIMYAAVFICSAQFICLLKIFAWQMIHRNGIKQEIKKLAIGVAELNRIIKNR